jgi:hypothetical protein
MTRHEAASCARSERTYESVFFHPPYQTCAAGTDDPIESAEIDSDSMVVELYNTWTAAPTGQSALFSNAEADLTSRFGTPLRCNATTLEWRRGDSLDVLLRIAPVSQVGTEFDEGPYRLTRLARLGPLDRSGWGC